MLTMMPVGPTSGEKLEIVGGVGVALAAGARASNVTPSAAAIHLMDSLKIFLSGAFVLRLSRLLSRPYGVNPGGGGEHNWSIRLYMVFLTDA